MITDRLENWTTYFSGDAWSRAFEFLLSLSADSPEGDTPLDGERLFGRVMSYETRSPEEGLLESHQRYIDIQTTLDGAEGIEWFPRDSLDVKNPYDKETDVELYHRPEVIPARVDVLPGMFGVFFPRDAHLAQQVVGGKREHIKKAVVKVDMDLIGGASG